MHEQPTENRISTTVRTLFEGNGSSAPGGQLGVDSSAGSLSIASWRRGAELPPFNVSMVATLNGILDGSIVPAAMEWTKGVVLQLYHLIFIAKPPDLKVKSWADFYGVLGACAHGQAVPRPPPAVDRLRMLFVRKNSPHQCWCAAGPRATP